MPSLIPITGLNEFAADSAETSLLETRLSSKYFFKLRMGDSNKSHDMNETR